MKSSAVLLIDLENFYCSREEFLQKNGQPGPYDRKAFAADLEKLLAFAREMVQPLPFTVRRAYANFTVYRFEKALSTRQFYLRDVPDELMKQGVEPVQVFRLSQGGRSGGSKNAADMRMAMEATALLTSSPHVEHFVLVTGDADFIPVILELKRHGHAVSVIGVTNATNGLIQRFVDNFELFEDLVAAEEVEAQSGQAAPAAVELTEVAAALRQLLGRTRPLKFAAVKPLLSKELNRPFDPLQFECDTTGEFLRKYAARFALEVRQGPHDWLLDLPTGHSKAIARPTARAPESAHTPELYRKLLGGGGSANGPIGPVKVPLVRWESWAWLCDAAFAALAASGGTLPSPTLLSKLTQAAVGGGPAELHKQVQRVYPFARLALGSTSTDGTVTLPAAATSPAAVRTALLRYLTGVIAHRLREQNVAGPLRPEVVAAALEAEQLAAEVAAVLPFEEPAPAAEAAVNGRKPPAPEEAHSAAGYASLLKSGGPRGSETEGLKLLPVPWPLVERISDAAFLVLSPSAGGGPRTPDELRELLVEEGKDSHVRRVIGLIRTAEQVFETDGRLVLRSDVGSADDLRWRLLMFALSLLHYRLNERGVPGAIRPESFAAAIDAGPLAERIAVEVGPVIPQLDSEPVQEPTAAAVPAEASLVDSAAGPHDEEDEVPIGAPDPLEGVTPSLLSGKLMIDPAAVADEPPGSKLPPTDRLGPPVVDDEDALTLDEPPTSGDPASAIIRVGAEEFIVGAVPVGDWIPFADAIPAENHRPTKPPGEVPARPAGSQNSSPSPPPSDPSPPEFA